MNDFSQKSTPNVLVSVPPYAKRRKSDSVYLPYIFGLLKSYCDEQDDLMNQVNWLSPIYRYANAEELLKGYKLEEVDVLALSCYCWNWRLQLQIATLVKAANPKCLVVLGGPEPSYEDYGYFGEYPVIDIVVKEDGEIPFAKILREWKAGGENYSSIPGLICRDKNNVPHVTGPCEKLKGWSDKSPYADLNEMETIANEMRARGSSILVMWETSRGCPYHCAFCDWGSNTFSKIRVLSDARIRREVEWFGKIGVTAILITDANFGIMRRDVTHSELLVEVREKTGFPKSVYWFSAKNNPERVFEISSIMQRGGLMGVLTVGFQSLDDQTLNFMGRENIKKEKFLRLVDSCRKESIPMTSNIILGAPGETVDAYKDGIDELMDLGFHDELRVHLYSLLPNAPASSNDYRSKHSIRSIKRRMVTERWITNELPSLAEGHAEYIVGHNQMTLSDWVQMNLFTAHVSANHNLGFTRYIAIYLREKYGISYRNFYEQLMHRIFSELGGVAKYSYEFLVGHFERFLEDENALYVIDPGLNSFSYTPEEFLYIRLIDDLESYMKIVKVALNDLFESVLAEAEVEALIEYQSKAIVTRNVGESKEAFIERVLTPINHRHGLTLLLPDEFASQPYFAEVNSHVARTLDPLRV